MADTKPTAQAAGAPPVPKSRRGFKGFFAEVGREMKKVNWPTRPETNRLTGVVLAVCLLIGIIISTLSWLSSIIVAIITKGTVG
jgi:preprotein translocase SecE subunit